MSEWFQANAWHYLLLYVLVSFVLTILQVSLFLPLFSKRDNDREKILLVCSEVFAVVWSSALAFWFAYNSYQIGFFFLSGLICADWYSNLVLKIARIPDKLKGKES